MSEGTEQGLHLLNETVRLTYPRADLRHSGTVLPRKLLGHGNPLLDLLSRAYQEAEITDVLPPVLPHRLLPGYGLLL